MQVADLGRLTGPVLGFGGPYSNGPALAALRAEAARRGIVPEAAICTGDVVAYGAQAEICVSGMRDWGAICIAGNCEKQLARNASDCGCGFEPGTTCDRLSAAWYGHASADIGPESRAWMAARPDLAVFQLGGMRYGVIHGGVSDVARFLWPVSEEAAFAEEIAALEALVGPVDAVLAGHCGFAFARRIGRHLWINAGVIGLPPHDGSPDTRFALLHADRPPELARLRYNHAASARSMVAAGLTQGYHDSLVTGWWPSEEVLPDGLRRDATADAVTRSG
ncbi:metallophosphoesterase [Cognatishimia sp. F0-27]|uniref:metallophosphoesterase family protein n=1 Tax=Cognatishimia sp. F0-27 TaxID=2816855 RepID=UPI001D0C30E4|nr:metallophosphoesterase family protein [Cognatishimia sp. F0-27]MCC1491812.1 metallophosphoesterase family protein [Cognatishimia sp. F0-27]